MFVQCRGTRFVLGDETFFARGVNSYFLGFCSNAVRKETLAEAKALGANTVRTWAFRDVDGSQGAPAFQFLRDGAIVHNDGPTGLERFDHLLCQAEEMDLKLILPLVNGWPDFGGMPAYLRWLHLDSDDVSEFYRNDKVRCAYRCWVEHVLTRRNIFTDRLYYQEPAVLAWELANEPRCPGESGCELLLEWTDEMSRFIKALDPNHLVALGDEGFFHRKSRSHLYDGRYGMDFDAALQCMSIDFGTFHLYPQHWGESRNLNFPSRWICDHIQAGAYAGKPVLLEEFGWCSQGRSNFPDTKRGGLYARWIEEMLERGGAGALAWMLGNASQETAGFRDEYTFFGLESPDKDVQIS